MRIRIILSLFLIVQVLGVNSQEFDWATSVSGDNYEYGIKVEKDSFGNTYLIGYTTDGPIEYEGITYTTNGGGDAFFAKLDTNKELIWMKTIGGNDTTYHDEALDIHIDPFGDIYLSFRAIGNSFTYNGEILSGINSSGTGEAVLIKVNSNGDYFWHDSGTGGSLFMGITTDATGNLYITGHFGSTITLGGSITLTNPSSGTTTDLLLAKYQPDGTIIWAKNAGGTPHNTFAHGIDLEISPVSNEIIVLAKADGEVYIDGILMPVNSNSNEGSVLISLDLDGNINWMNKILDLETLGHYNSTGLSISDTGIIGAVGFSTGFKVGLVGFYEPDGTIITEHKHPFNDSVIFYSIDFNEYDNAYISGRCLAGGVIGISPDTISITNPTGFIVKISPDQQAYWVSEFISSYFSNNVVYNSGKLLYAGRIDDTFIYNSGQNTIENNAGDAIFAEAEDSTLTVETYLEEIMTIYPNPTTKTVNISFENTVDNVELSLLNVQGQIISEQIFINLSHVDLELPDSFKIYFLTIKTSEGQTTVKLIKE